jgi:hypothetical protein
MFYVYAYIREKITKWLMEIETITKIEQFYQEIK